MWVKEGLGLDPTGKQAPPSQREFSDEDLHEEERAMASSYFRGGTEARTGSFGIWGNIMSVRFLSHGQISVIAAGEQKITPLQM